MPKLTFEEWKRQVNHHVLSIAQVTVDDIGDYDYRIAYDNGESPKQVARRALKAADFPFGG